MLEKQLYQAHNIIQMYVPVYTEHTLKTITIKYLAKMQKYTT